MSATPSRTTSSACSTLEGGPHAEHRDVGVRGLHRGDLVAQPGVRHRGGREDVVHVVVAAGGEVEEVDAGSSRAASRSPRGGLRHPSPAGGTRSRRSRMPTTKSSPTRSRTAAEHLAREAGAPVEVAAVRVGARVVERREELVQQVPVGDVDLDAVEPALAVRSRPTSPTRSVNSRMSATLISRVACAVDGDSMRDGAYTARGPSGPSGDACAPWWFSWTNTLRPGLVDRVGHATVGADRLRAEGVLEAADRAGRMHELVAGDEQAAPAPCAGARSRPSRDRTRRGRSTASSAPSA